MIFLIYISLGIIASIIAFVSYILILYPIFRFSQMKRKYGDKVKVFFSIGQGILKFYNQDLANKNDSIAFIRNMHEPNLKAIAFNFGTKVGFSFVDPELQKQVLQNPHSYSKVDGPMAITFLFANSIAYATEKEWKRQRLFLGKSFHFEEIKNYFPLIIETCQKTIKKIDQKLIERETINIQILKTCQEITSEVSFKVFFGSNNENLTIITRKDGSSTTISNELVQVLIDSYYLFQTDKVALIKWILLKRKSTSFFLTKGEEQLLNRLKALRQACTAIVSKRKEELTQDRLLAKKNFLDQYIIEMAQNENSGITYDEIIDNFSAIYLAGTDTTSNMAGVALYYLSLYPEIQQQAREEVIKVLSVKLKENKTDQLFSLLAFEDLQNLNLINSILKESLRLMPPAIQSQTKFANQDIKIGEFDVKKGDLVTNHFSYNLSNPEVFPNPDVFNPNRWMAANIHNEMANFTPFSQGPRNCIGQHLAMIEGKCILASLLLQYEILPNPAEKVVRQMRIVYGFQYDNLVYFKKINV
ncbi:cytochrome P450 family monooxygenase (macronuclear) [Tetrahymena thermophila SB210]|uniref:Cytochrome P450 family monooxygenase n=2 Tax=Tetrahymena thermophila TaxID=5911 RepID=Q23JU9_TETTS|nr:cytochrome P450 family monooxygenase [Tetrahymena thermophila SB210]ABY59961.1 cytochrome P450 monooxygenase CYP5005A20 [Tetrahymena thermophila]EAR96810.2 cytochrome P450 family monooxygenase [Tetrahymena thermophila SB210]|eukprot:XP_001017055.2 cytochrome P450 family monooxygenase [Tetrahymena thermophila SB210]